MKCFALPCQLQKAAFLLLFLLFFKPLLSFGQKDSVSLASEYYTEGMAVYDFSHRKQAAELFILSTKMNPRDAKAQLMAGKSIMLSINKELSLPYFLRAMKLNPAVDEEILFYIGRGYHYAEKFDSAIIFYQAYNKKLSRSLDLKKSAKMNEADRKISECRNAVVYKEHPVQVTITNLSDKINSEYPDYAPTLTADGQTMIFTSRRPDNNANANVADDHDYFEEILEAKKVNGNWQSARIMPAPVNSRYHNSCLNLSPDGQEMFIYNDTNGGDIYVTYQHNGVWSQETPLKGEINTPGPETSASITRDGQKLYFSSIRSGGYGGFDIFVATKTKSGQWTNVTNLGPVVNTELDEDGVFISANGKHLYFSSNGHAGMGDDDIYRSTYDSVKGEWGTPLNLGYPINSPENDTFFVLSGDEKTAYFSSARPENKGEEDIYQVDMTQWRPLDIADIIAEASHEPLEKVLQPMKAANTQIDVEYFVVDAATSTPVEAKVHLVGPDNKEIPMNAAGKGTHTARLAGADGKKERYGVRVTAQDYQEYESHIYIVGNVNQPVHIVDTIYMKKTPTVQFTGILNVYFPSESDVPQSLVDIWSIEKYLKENIASTVQISGHTDSNGEANYNMNLSHRRAEAVKRYLVKAGIQPDRITAVGFGEERPAADNATAKGRSMNRRTEFAILNYTTPKGMKKNY